MTPKTMLEKWPALPLGEWEETYTTLHMWSQVVGKIRLALTPPINHSWNVTLYVTARGLTTSPMFFNGLAFEMSFDFIDHELRIECADGRSETIPLEPMSVADFYQRVMETLARLNIKVKIWTLPCEVPNPIPFEKNTMNKSYDPEYANRHWRILLQLQKVMMEFRSHFIGKCSPVHFFWGSFDMAVTRFSGRAAPPRNDPQAFMREAYSHEVISHGFWPGRRGALEEPVFYAYSAPEPAGFGQAAIRPSKAFYNPDMKEYFLRYDDVRQSSDPESMLMEFLQSTYDAGATLAKWDRASLER